MKLSTRTRCHAAGEVATTFPADAPVLFWEFGSQVAFPEIVRFLAFTGELGRFARNAVAAMRGVGRLGYTELTTQPPTEQESTLSFLLQQLWFASLVGWSAGLFEHSAIVEQLRVAGELLSRGLASPPKK